MKPRALVLGKVLCQYCMAAEAQYAKAGYDVKFRDIDRDPDALALHQLLDGGDTVPVIILRGVPGKG